MFLIVIKPSLEQYRPPKLSSQDSSCSIHCWWDEKQNNLNKKLAICSTWMTKSCCCCYLRNDAQATTWTSRMVKNKNKSVFWQGFRAPQVFRRCFTLNCSRLAADSCCEWSWSIKSFPDEQFTCQIVQTLPPSLVMIFRSAFCFLLHKFSISVANLMEEVWTSNCLICIPSTSNDLCNKSRLESPKT